MVYGCRKIHLLSSLKSDIKRSMMSFLGMRNVGALHWERLTFLMILRASTRSSSCLNVISCINGTGKVFDDMVLHMV